MQIANFDRKANKLYTAHWIYPVVSNTDGKHTEAYAFKVEIFQGRNINSEKKSEFKRGFEPKTLCDLVGCSNHWATGDSMVSKGEGGSLTGTASRSHTAKWCLGAYKLTNSTLKISL